MESPMPSAETVFKVCGVEIPLVGIDLPDAISIAHSIPEAFEEHARLRQDRKKCDVIIRVGAKTLHLHKDLLIVQIPYFKNLFDSNMTECAKGEVNFSNTFCGYDSATIESLLDFAYTGRLTINTANVQDLMMGANFFRLDSVMDECAQFMRRRLSMDNVFSLLNFCRSIAYDKIDAFLLSFIDKNFVPFSLTADFLELSIDELVDFLERDSLYVDKEEQVFEAITRWISKDASKKEHAARLLKCLRCNRCPTNTETLFTDTLEKTEWLMADPECASLVGEAKEYIGNKEVGSNLQSFKMHERVCDDSHQLLISIDETFVDDNSYEFTIRLYDPVTNKWTECPNSSQLLNKPYMEYMCIVENKIHFSRNRDAYDICAIFDTNQNKWYMEQDEIKREMQLNLSGWTIRRNAFETSEFIDGRGYFVGGEDAHGNPMNTLEVCEWESKIWSSRTPMAKARSYASSCVLNGNVYVLGGRDFSGQIRLAFSECERYDPKNDRWMPVSSMNRRRFLAGVAVLHRQIYVVGGFTEGKKTIGDAERYNPGTDTWTTIEGLKSPRSFPVLWVSCGKLWAFKGYDDYCGDSACVVNSVEMFDPERGSWVSRALAEPLPSEYHVVLPLALPASFTSPVANLENIWFTVFPSLNLKEGLLKAIAESELIQSAEAQLKGLPQAIQGKDVVCRAASRRVASAAHNLSIFVIATLQQIEPVERNVSVLVLCPTLNSAARVGEEYERFSKYLPKTTTAIFAVRSPVMEDKEVIEKNRPRIVMGTPARILALVRSAVIKPAKIKHLVLESCDQMVADLEMHRAVLNILELTPKKKQILINTVALPRQLQQLCNKFVKQ